MKDVVIVSACRTAIGTFGGTLKDVILANLGAVVMKEAVKRAGIDPSTIDDVRFGCCMEHVNTLNTTRTAALLAGIPVTVPAVTINRVCPSGMEATASGMAMIQAGMADIVLVGGMEHMSGVPYSSLDARWGCRLQDKVLVDCIIRGLHCGSYVQPLSDDSPVKESPLFDMFKGKPYIMGQTAEFIASLYNISREEMDEVALKSHNGAERANKEGDFAQEIIPVEIPNKKKGKPPIIFDKDETIRFDIDKSKIAKLKPVFRKDGTVTAANSCGLSDGSASMVVTSRANALSNGIKPLFSIVEFSELAIDPAFMGEGPVYSIPNVLSKAGMTLDDIDLIEINEAFAVQVLSNQQALGFNMDKLNVNGGAIALGHPTGISGARIIITLYHALLRLDKTFGLASICGGGGVSTSIIIKREF